MSDSGTLVTHKISATLIHIGSSYMVVSLNLTYSHRKVTKQIVKAPGHLFCLFVCLNAQLYAFC